MPAPSCWLKLPFALPLRINISCLRSCCGTVPLLPPTGPFPSARLFRLVFTLPNAPGVGLPGFTTPFSVGICEAAEDGPSEDRISRVAGGSALAGVEEEVEPEAEFFFEDLKRKDMLCEEDYLRAAQLAGGDGVKLREIERSNEMELHQGLGAKTLGGRDGGLAGVGGRNHPGAGACNNGNRVGGGDVMNGWTCCRCRRCG